MESSIIIYSFDRRKPVTAIRALRNIAASRKEYISLRAAKDAVDALCDKPSYRLEISCMESERPLLAHYLTLAGAILHDPMTVVPESFDRLFNRHEA